jgi:hypothetical protein
MLAALLLAVLATGARAAVPDYAEYQQLLDRYVMRLDPRSKDTDTRFDYDRLYVDERIHQQQRSARLERIRASLVGVRPSELAPADRIAWAINTYNFLVIERATLNLLIPGKRLVRQRSVEDIRSPQGAFFSARVVDVEGRPYSLTEFERRFVYDDTTQVFEPRNTPVDARRSLALCAGHVGDPPLSPRAYRADSLEAQLDAAARAALAQPRFARFNAGGRRLDVSDYLARRRIDFGGTVDSVIPFVERYGPPELRKNIRRFQIRRVTLVMPVDPALNHWPRSRPAPATHPQNAG